MPKGDKLNKREFARMKKHADNYLDATYRTFKDQVYPELNEFKTGNKMMEEFLVEDLQWDIEDMEDELRKNFKRLL
mgnify:FL=1